MNRRRLLVSGVPAVAGAVIAQRATAAQTPAPRSLHDMLPSPDELGNDMELVGRTTPDIRAQVFTDRLFAAYGGARGRRILVILLRHKTDARSVQDGWVAARQLLDALSSALPLSQSRGMASAAQDWPLPAGVANAERLTGTNLWWTQPLGMAIYAYDPGVIAAIVADGEFDERLGISGAGATDRVAAIIARRIVQG